MSYIKYDDDLCNSVKDEITTLQSEINGCFDSISNGAKNAKISLDDPRVVVIEEVTKKPNFIAGIFGAKDEIVKEEVANYSANASIYNDNLDSLNKKALEIKKDVNDEIKKVVNALGEISLKVNEYENSPLTELNKFEVEYEESSYGFLYGYASVGSAITGDEDDSITNPEVPVGSDGSAKDKEDEKPVIGSTPNNNDNKNKNGEDEEEPTTGTHTGNDGDKDNSTEDDDTSLVTHTGSDGGDKDDSREDDDTSLVTHTGSDGGDKDSSDNDVVVDGYTGNDGNKNDSSSEDANNWLVHTGNNGNTNGTSNEGVTVGTHNGNDGNQNNLSDSDNLNSNNNDGSDGKLSGTDDDVLDALLGVVGNNGNINNNKDNDFNTGLHTGNNGDRDDLLSGDSDSFGKNSLDGNYEGMPNTGLFGGAIVGGVLSSSNSSSDSSDKYKGKYEKYSLIFKVFNTIIPFIILLILGGIVSGILSNAIFSTLLIGVILFNYYYINKLFNYWVDYYKNKFGNNGNPLFNDGNSNENKKNRRSDYIIFVSYIVSSLVIFVLTILEWLKSYWFILLLILLLIIIWLVVTDKDEVTSKKQDMFIKILYIISVLLSLVFTIILVVKGVLPWYWILFVILVFTILLTYLIILKKYRNNI